MAIGIDGSNGPNCRFQLLEPLVRTIGIGNSNVKKLLLNQWFELPFQWVLAHWTLMGRSNNGLITILTCLTGSMDNKPIDLVTSLGHVRHGPGLRLGLQLWQIQSIIIVGGRQGSIQIIMQWQYVVLSMLLLLKLDLEPLIKPNRGWRGNPRGHQHLWLYKTRPSPMNKFFFHFL